ncbi:MAG: hypothetical protein PHC75_08690 [Burkholderiales bacterium]|nr:hypothetical protein [Burkholderiales bacterium]
MLLMLGILGFGISKYNSSININTINKQQLNLLVKDVNGVGDETVDKIIKNQPYESVDDF